MAIRVNGNQTALNLNKNLNNSTKSIQDNFSKLSSGNRINRPSSDASGLQIAEQLASEIRNSGQASRNISDAVSFLSIADASLSSASDIVVRLEELAMQSANGALSDSQRNALNSEYQGLSSELDRISNQSTFNGTKVLGSTTSIQTGTDGSATSQLTISLTDVNTSSLSLSGRNISSQANAVDTLAALKNSREMISSARAEVGANESRLQTSFSNLQTQRLSNVEARDRIASADVAEESSKLVANRIMQSANVSLMKVNNTNLTSLLNLLKT